MSLKDFSFKQLDKTAKLSVGVEKKSDKTDESIARNNASARSCSQIHQKCF